MRKILFFQAYIGVQSDAEELIFERIRYLEVLLSFVHHCIISNSVKGHFFLVPTCPEFADEKVKSVADRYGFSVYFDEFHRNNEYEYPGLNAMLEFSKGVTDECAILYLHTKGIFNRRNRSLGIFRTHVSTLMSVDVGKVFSFPRVEKICLFPSKKGWAWQNFFWVRSGFVRGRALIKTDNRHYYEAWIGGAQEGYRECFPAIRRLIPEITDQYFEPENINHNELVQSVFRLYSIG